MPILLEPSEIGNRFDAYKSVLIVPCQVCPKMCITALHNEACIDLTALSGKNSFTGYIDNIRKSLADKGIRSAVFKPPVSAPMMCLWPDSARKRLTKKAGAHDAIAVIGCESAVATALSAVTHNQIVQVMANRGIANFTSSFSLPFKMKLVATAHTVIQWPEKEK